MLSGTKTSQTKVIERKKRSQAGWFMDEAVLGPKTFVGDGWSISGNVRDVPILNSLIMKALIIILLDSQAVYPGFTCS